MIKVNFNQKKTSMAEARTRGLAPTGTSQILNQFTETLKEKQSLLDTQTLVKFIFNIIIVLCFPIGLKIYEIKEIRKLEKLKAQEQSILDQKNQQLASVKKELEAYAYLEDLSKEFSTKRAFLSEISSGRLVVPRVIDFIQNKIPKGMWLTNVKIDLQNLETAKLSISGFSIKEASINYFTNSLEAILQRESILVNTRDIKDSQSQTITKTNFSLKGNLN